jgi:hypothetical protein
MGNIIKWFKNLDIFVSTRRDAKYATDRSAPDHPERIPVEGLTTNNEIDQEPELPSVPIVTTASTASSFIKCSDFYLACRNNNVDEVKRLLETIDQCEMDIVEPNGSTALHAASFHGHREVVRLLLTAGADRALHNKYNYLPFDEAKDDEIKELFNRIPTCNRFISNTGGIEWELIDDDDVSEKAREERDMIKSLYEKVPIDKMFERIEKNYIGKGLANYDGI